MRCGRNDEMHVVSAQIMFIQVLQLGITAHSKAILSKQLSTAEPASKGITKHHVPWSKILKEKQLECPFAEGHLLHTNCSCYQDTEPLVHCIGYLMAGCSNLIDSPFCNSSLMTMERAVMTLTFSYVVVIVSRSGPGVQIQAGTLLH